MTEYLDIDLGKDDPDCRISIEVNEKGTHFYMDMGGGTIKPETEMKIFLALESKLKAEGRLPPQPVSTFKETVDKATHELECEDYILVNGGKDCIVCRRHIVDHDCEDLMNLSGTCDMCGRRVR